MLVFCGAAVMAAPSAFASELEDAVVTARVETALTLNEQLNPFNIGTSTEDGVVTLSGTVNNDAQKDLAEEVAKGAKGVSEVINTITVVDEPAPPREKRGWLQRIEDSSVATAIRSRLLYHREFKGLRLGVKVHNNVATLTGITNSEAQRERIAQVASETRGVKQVVNALSVIENDEAETIVDSVVGTISDEAVEKRVEQAILFNRHVSILELDVEVDNGRCILTGTVSTEQEKEAAESIAANVGGVDSVVNELRVREMIMPAEEVPDGTASGENGEPAEGS